MPPLVSLKHRGMGVLQRGGVSEILGFYRGVSEISGSWELPYKRFQLAVNVVGGVGGHYCRVVACG